MLAFETDVQHETAPSDPCKQVGLLLLSVIWYLVAWNILVGFPEGVYWHFLDPYNLGFDLPPVIVLIIAILSSLVLDIGAVQSVVSSHPNLVAALPPLLFALSAIPNVYARSTFLTFAAASLGWSATATIGAAPVTILREFGVPACLTASYTMLMLRWLCDSLDPFLQSPWMKVALGCEGILAVVIFSTCEGPRKSGAAGGSCKCDCRGWLPALSAGLMGGSALALCQTYLSTATQPAGSTLLMPSYILGLVSVALVGVITVVLSIASRHAPDWIESRLARCMGAYVPLMACVLQLYAGVSIELFGRIRGTGTLAYLGLLTLAGVFPFMLAFLAKGFDDAAKVGRTGTAVCVVGLVWAVFFLIYFAVLTGGSAPIGGALFKAKSWLLALMLGFLWCAGVACMQESSLVPSPYYSIAEQQHSHRAPNVSLLLLAAVSVVFFAVAVPIKTAFKPTAPELGYERSLVVVAYNIQQGFTLEPGPRVVPPKPCPSPTSGPMGATSSRSASPSLVVRLAGVAVPVFCCSAERSEQSTLPPMQLKGSARGERVEAMLHELFCLQDLGDDGLLDEEELVRLNQQIAVLHYGRDTDLAAVRSKFVGLFRERLHPEGRPVPFEAFRIYMLKALDSMDRDEASQEMAMEHFIDEAASARIRFLGCESLECGATDTLLVPSAKHVGALGGC